MTKDEYVALILSWPLGWPGPPDVPIDWAREVWELPEVYENVSYSIARDVGKTGSLCRTAEYLGWLADTLTGEQVVRLYLDIRDKHGCVLREEEFRPEFLAAFARHAHAIPPALTEGEVAARLGMTVEEMVTENERMHAESVSPPPCDTDDIPF